MHKKDSTFEMNLKVQYYCNFLEIQFKIQDLRLYYSTADHILQNMINIGKRIVSKYFKKNNLNLYNKINNNFFQRKITQAINFIPNICMIMIFYAHKDIAIKVVYFRSPSRMSISRSHPGHLVNFRERKKKQKHLTSIF